MQKYHPKTEEQSKDWYTILVAYVKKNPRLRFWLLIKITEKMMEKHPEKLAKGVLFQNIPLNEPSIV